MLTLTPDLKSAAAALTADDWMLLAQVGKTSTLADVLSRSTLEEAHTVALLGRLIELGVLSISHPGAEGVREGHTRPAAASEAFRCGDGPLASAGRRSRHPDILELDGCEAARQVSEEQRLRAQSSVAAALEAASVSPVPAPDPRRNFAAGGRVPPAGEGGPSKPTLHFGPSPVPSEGGLREGMTLPFGPSAVPFDEARLKRTLHFGASPVPAISPLAPEAATLPFGSSTIPLDASLNGGTLHFGPSPVPAISAATSERVTVPFGASPVPSASPSATGTLHFGRSPVPPGGAELGPPAFEGASSGATLHFGPSTSTGSVAGERETLAFGSPGNPEAWDSAAPAISPVPTVARLAAHESTPPTGAEAFNPRAADDVDGDVPGGLAAPSSDVPSSDASPSAARLSPRELEAALADTLISAPRPPELEKFLGSRAASTTDAGPTSKGAPGDGERTPMAASALLLETEVFDGIGPGASSGAPPPLSWSDEAADEVGGSADASVVLAGMTSDRAELVAELTEAATHGTATEPPDGDAPCAGHSEGLPFTPAPSVHSPGRAKARETARPAREAKLPPNVYEEVLRLEALASKGDLYAVFSLPRGASPAEVKKAFHSLSRRLHPDHYFHLGGGAQKARLETVFRHITEAHATLVDPERRRAWAEANPSLSRARAPIERPAPRAPDAEQRDEERRERLARHPYLLKQAQPLMHLTQGKALLARGEFGEALELLERARTADPQNPEITRLLTSAREGQKVRRAAEEEAQGRRAEDQGRLDEAVACYRRAATLDPSNGAVALQAARMLEREGGDLREARLFAQRAVELRPTDADAQWLLAQILLRSGARKLARGPLEEVLRLQPKHPSARSQLRQLRLGL